MRAGYIDPANLLFAKEHVTRIRDIAAKRHDDILSLDVAYAEIHRDHPFHDAPDFIGSLRRLLEQPDFKSILELN